MKREEALEILASEGVLLVLCSLIDNMPYVVAEAAVHTFALPVAALLLPMHKGAVLLVSPA